MGLFRRFRATRRTNRAFHLVEQGEIEGAVTMLRKAIAIDPTYGHAHSELAFVLGKILHQLDEAEEEARKAVECDPRNPKFNNMLTGILSGKMSGLGSRKAVLAAATVRIRDLETLMAADPTYPPYHLAKAAAMAASGCDASAWIAELSKASESYQRQTHAACGLPLGPNDAAWIVARSRQDCERLAENWQTLPPG